jgi:Tol biopolymer transport system component
VKTHPLVLETDYVSGLSWLPDGSGFLYSTQRFGYSSNQIIRFDFDSKKATVLVEGSIHLGGVVVSPDGRYFSFADRADEHAPFDLFGQALNGGPRWKIASDIVSWDWGPMPAAGVKEKYQ